MTNEKIKVIMFSRRMNGFIFLIEEKKKKRVSFYDERRKTKVMIYFEQNDR